jgi:hypothetical protein
MSFVNVNEKLYNYIELIKQKDRETYPILCISGIRFTGKRTKIQTLFKEKSIRLNTLSYLNGNLKQYLQRLFYDRNSHINIMSMFEKKPTPVTLCIPFFDRFVQHEKPAARVLQEYLSKEEPKSCMPIIFIVNEPFSYQKYEEFMKYVSIFVRLSGVSREDCKFGDQEKIFNYCNGSYRKLNRIRREHKNLKKSSIELKDNFIEDEERVTMTQRMRLFFSFLNRNKFIPDKINEWMHSLQETEITTMMQTIHENILNHTEQTTKSYYKFLKTIVYTNELQLIQQLYNRHAIEPYWSYASIVIPFKSNYPKSCKKPIQFTRMLTRSSIYSNYKNFIQSVERKTHCSLQKFIHEYSLLLPEDFNRKQLVGIQNQFIKKLNKYGLNNGEARRLIRTIERIRKGGM